MDDDLALLERWRAGDNAAGQALFARHLPSVLRFFTTKCEAEAEELTQATFLACVRAKDQFQQRSSFRTYLFTIARNQLHHHLRTKARKLDKLDFDLSSLADIGTTVGTQLDRAADHRRLIEALHQLPVETQTLLELHYWEGMSADELAEVFGTTGMNVRSRLTRARKALRATLEAVAPADALRDDATMDHWMSKQEI